jgi:hypothetical protein
MLFIMLNLPLLLQSIKRGAKVRIRLMGIRTDQTELFAIGSIKGDFLGLLDQ